MCSFLVLNCRMKRKSKFAIIFFKQANNSYEVMMINYSLYSLLVEIWINPIPMHSEFRTQKAQRASTSVKIRGGGKVGERDEGDWLWKRLNRVKWKERKGGKEVERERERWGEHERERQMGERVDEKRGRLSKRERERERQRAWE